MPRGRPRKLLNRKAADYICERIATSDLSLEEVLAEVNKNTGYGITLWNVFSWNRENAEFSKQYAHARENQAEYMADLAYREAKNARIGQIKKQTRNKQGVETVEVRTEDNVARSRLIVDTIWRRAGQLKPKVFRERTAGETGEQGPNEQLEALQKALLDGAVEDEQPVETKPGSDETKAVPGETKPPDEEPKK